MEHIFFEVQLCIEMLIFNEKHAFPLLIILCLVTSLASERFPRMPGPSLQNTMRVCWDALTAR